MYVSVSVSSVAVSCSPCVAAGGPCVARRHGLEEEVDVVVKHHGEEVVVGYALLRSKDSLPHKRDVLFRKVVVRVNQPGEEEWNGGEENMR